MAQSSLLANDGATVNPFEDKSTIKVMTCEPSAGLVDCQVYDNRIDFYMEQARLESRSKFKFFSRNTGRMGVNYAREAMANFAIINKMDYMLCIDDDQIVPKDMFERLYASMIKNEADIIAPMVTQRVPPFYPVMWKHSWFDENGKKAINCDFIKDYEPNSVVVCDAIGFGVALVKVSILEKVNAPRFFSNNSFGEDIWFCMKARAAGAKIVMDTSIKVGHLRPPEIATERDYVKANNLVDKFKSVYGVDGNAPLAVAA